MIFEEILLSSPVKDRYDFLSKLGQYLKNDFNSVKEHDTTHYIEYIKITFEYKDLKVQLYWCDELNNHNKLCLDFYHTNKEPISNIVVIKIKETIISSIERFFNKYTMS